MKKVYLAGPDVFRKDAKQHGLYLREQLALAGVEGLYPLDNEVELTGDGPADALTIYEANIEMIKKCDGVLAHACAFRGPSMDVGTAFEIGFAKALGKPIVLYGTDGIEYKQRIDRNYSIHDLGFPIVEDFGLFDNLMIACSSSLICNWRISVRDAAVFLKELMY